MTDTILGQDATSGNLIRLSQTARLQGLYVTGAPGTGKSTLIENILVQDVQHGLGICLLDPHGDTTLSILSRLPYYRERDVIFLDIADTEYPFGLNLFECSDPTNALEVQKILSQVMHIFHRLFDITPSTPRVYEFLYNCSYTIIVNPGYTIVDIPLLLTDEKMRRKLVANVTSPDVVSFWDYYNRLVPSEQHEMSESILRRMAEFTLDHIARNIVGQSETTIDFKRVMDTRKILLVKLDARLSNLTSLVGSAIVEKLLNASYARPKRKGFNLFIDEFQRFATEDAGTLLTEARKFGIALTIAHQYGDQLDRQMRDAALNLANHVIFRVSGTDAAELAKEFVTAMPNEVAAYLMTLGNFKARVKLTEDGKTVERSINILPPEEGLKGVQFEERLARIREQNIRDGYRRSRTTVEDEIRTRQQNYDEVRTVTYHQTSKKEKVVVESTATTFDEGKVFYAAAERQRTVSLRINEEPLSAQNLATIISAIIQLHTKFWLILQGRFNDLVEYTQTLEPHYEEEANLIIARLAYNSPAIIEFLTNPVGVASAIASTATIALLLTKAIDAIAQLPLRFEEKKLEIAKKRADAMLDVANKLVTMMEQDANAEMKTKIVESIVPSLMDLSKGKGTQLALPPPKAHEEKS